MKTDLMPALSPMMQQYADVKAKLPSSALLAFRLGDFYEFFYDDAKVVAKALTLTLTKRREIPMAGIPVHAADRYLKALRDAGHEVAVCEAFLAKA